MKVIKLPFSTGLTDNGPKFQVEKENFAYGLLKVKIEYDYIGEEKPQRAEIIFGGVIAYKFIQESACSAEMIVPGLVDLEETSWLKECRKEWANTFSGERQKEMYGKFDFHHLLIYFDDFGCYEIISKTYEIKKLRNKPK